LEDPLSPQPGTDLIQQNLARHGTITEHRDDPVRLVCGLEGAGGCDPPEGHEGLEFAGVPIPEMEVVTLVQQALGDGPSQEPRAEQGDGHGRGEKKTVPA
jgi:hypothetical protein